MKLVLILVVLSGGCWGNVAVGQQSKDTVPAAPFTFAGCYHFLESANALASLGQARVPGEFERQQCLLMACSGDLTHMRTIGTIIRAIEDNIQPIVLVKDSFDREQLLEELKEKGADPDKVVVVFVEHNSKWTRDFGPTSMVSTRGVRLVDWLYADDRQQDDNVSVSLARITNTQTEFTPLELEGGNLLSNGTGVIITSEKFLFRNTDFSVGDLGSALARQLNATHLVVLEPLVGEETMHVDMFATFTSPNTVVVGSYDPQVDPVNAAVLDRNAEILSQVKTRNGPMNVVRIPMGSQDGACWRTYTNCIFANGVLLVPSYGDHDDSRTLQRVLATYRRLLPGWHIATVDATNLIEEGGALRCASLNIAQLNDAPVSTPENEIPDMAASLEGQREWLRASSRNTVRARSILMQ